MQEFEEKRAVAKRVGKWLGKQAVDWLLVSPLLLVLYFGFTGYYERNPEHRTWGMTAVGLMTVVAVTRRWEEARLPWLLQLAVGAVFVWAFVYGRLTFKLQLILSCAALLFGIWDVLEYYYKRRSESL